MNQDYRERVKRHLEAGGDPKYVNVKGKSAAKKAELAKKMSPHQEMDAKGMRWRAGDPRKKEKSGYASAEVDPKTGKYRNTY